MEKLEPKQIKHYLSYGLKLINLSDREGWIPKGSTTIMRSAYIDNVDGIDLKPILHPLSDLTKEQVIEFFKLGSITFEEQYWKHWKKDLIETIKYDGVMRRKQLERLYEWHIDVDGLIDQGLAVDINTLNQ